MEVKIDIPDRYYYELLEACQNSNTTIEDLVLDTVLDQYQALKFGSIDGKEFADRHKITIGEKEVENEKVESKTISYETIETETKVLGEVQVPLRNEDVVRLDKQEENIENKDRLEHSLEESEQIIENAGRGSSYEVSDGEEISETKPKSKKRRIKVK